LEKHAYVGQQLQMAMENKSFEKFQRFLVTFLIGVAFFYGGYYFGKRGYQVEIKKSPTKIEVTNKQPLDKRSNVDFKRFWDVWDIINERYLERPIDSQKLVQGAISGMVSALGDPYTSYLTPEVNKSLNDSLNGSYQGIGAELGIRDEVLIIVAPLEGSPAKSAGLKAGDKILRIENDSTAGMSVTDAVYRIRGEAGKSVKLTIQTGSQQARDVSITRGVITVSSVKWEDKGEGIAYIRVSRFGGDTNSEWDKAVREINSKMKELDTVVVDVRGNPGGYLNSAVHLAEEFYKGKPVIFEEDPAGNQKPLNANRKGAFHDVPAVYVLIDGGSASASEILAAALKDNVKAVLVGEKSFGKGTIQDALEFSDDSGLHVTIAKWLTPKKEWVHKKGINPDVEVKRTDEDFDRGIDPQLDKALELAKQL
jgi:carboxyl-terminal processing protease